MDKRTLLAVVLSVIVISAGFFLQSVLFPQKNKTAAANPAVTQSLQPSSSQNETQSGGSGGASQAPGTQTGQQPAGTTVQHVDHVVPDPTDAADLQPQTYDLKTNLFDVTFSNQGAVVNSIKLLQHLDNGQPLEMVDSGTTGLSTFNLSFGGPDAAPVTALFHFTKVNDTTYQFSRQFLAPAASDSPTAPSVPFTLTKTYIFHPDSYMLELKVAIDNSVNEYPNLDSNGYAYTVEYGPQIGPPFDSLGGRGEYRKYYTYAEGKRKNFDVPKQGEKTADQRLIWAAIVGKYFTVIGIPDATQYAVTYSSKPIQGIPDTSELFFSRPPIKSSKNTDTFQYYIGPKTTSTLTKYNNAAKNPYGLSGLNLDTVVDNIAILGWLEAILKWFLVLFYSLIPNWGVAIILLVVLIKLVLYPFTRKSFESTSKMQALAPKINELREKYKNNPQKLSQEQMALYKKEGVSPLGGCLPLLLQMPVFFALYYLLNSEFQLRGAVFIPGWITDLSQPESILHFNFTIPIVGWTDIRLLPIIYVATQVFSSRLMQNPDATVSNNMKLITYLMPVMFFFILYNAPSGLILYWTVMNILTVAQQMYMNHRRSVAAAAAAATAARAPTKIPPRRRK